ncbi:RIP metalloprotease RseP [Odoribacter sp. OttesenSCG-928-G04]|nr:RIP metalloprotease RseP [Odoribacter sp. OttesenSCG-928-G04]
MTLLIKIVQLLLSLSILVFIHELGHFFFAKLFKTRVEKFYLFFNPGFSLFKFKKGETEYGMGWLPLGGYVKISGMIDESMDTEQMNREPQAWEFRSKPAWQRLLIMAGGVMMNVILAFVIYIMLLFTWGENYLPMENIPNGITCDQLFIDMGMQNGDVIVALDHQKVDDFFKIVPNIMLNDPKTIEVRRNGEVVSLPVPEHLKAALLKEASSKSGQKKMFITPRILMDSMYIAGFADYSAAYDAGMRKNDRILSLNDWHPEFYDQFTTTLESLEDHNITTQVLRGGDTLAFQFKLGPDGKFGIMFASTEQLEYATHEYTFAESFPAGIRKGASSLTSYLKQFKLLFTPESEAYKSVGGVISMGNIFPGVWNWQVFWELTALISIMLAVVNILPIPALDGGHILFLLYEVVTRRKPSVKFMEYAQVFGMLFILGLFLLTTINDVSRFF